MFPLSILLISILTHIRSSSSLIVPYPADVPKPSSSISVNAYPLGVPKPSSFSSSSVSVNAYPYVKPSYNPDFKPAPDPSYHIHRLHRVITSASITVSANPSASITVSANASRNQNSSSAPATSTAASQRGAGDPCGPGNQTDFESTLNTCGSINTTYTQSPSTYGVQCLNANPSLNQSINTTACASNIDNICLTMISTRATVSQWNWSSGVCLHSLLFLLLLLLAPRIYPEDNFTPKLKSHPRVPTAP